MQDNYQDLVNAWLCCGGGNVGKRAGDAEWTNRRTEKGELTQSGNAPAVAVEPFDGASVEKMASQCVTLETELGAIEIAFIPQSAPEAVRNFLNLSATGAYDTTTFSRTVKGFVIQGGNLQTSEKWSEQLARRMSRTIPDEPGLIKHERGIVSMARTDAAEQRYDSLLHSCWSRSTSRQQVFGVWDSDEGDGSCGRNQSGAG